MTLDFSGTFKGTVSRAVQKNKNEYPTFDTKERIWIFTKAAGNFYVKQNAGSSNYEIAQVEEVKTLCGKNAIYRLTLVDDEDNGVAYLYPIKVKNCKVLEYQLISTESGFVEGNKDQKPTLSNGVLRRV